MRTGRLVGLTKNASHFWLSLQACLLFIASLCSSVFLFCFAFLSWALPTPARFWKKARQKLLCFVSLCSLFILCDRFGCFGQLRSLRSLKALRAFGFPHQPIFFIIASLCFSLFFRVLRFSLVGSAHTRTLFVKSAAKTFVFFLLLLNIAFRK